METRKPYDIDSLTDIALRVFAEKGYDGATMDDVARAAGITKASIYHHVSGKEGLLERGLTRALDALFGVLSEAAAQTGPAVARLRYIVGRVSETTLERLPEVTILVRVRGNSPVERAALTRRRAFDRTVTELVAQAQRERTVRADLDARLITRLIFGMSNSIVEWYRDGAALSAESIAQAVGALAFAGLESRPS